MLEVISLNSNAAPVIDRSRMVHVVLLPPYSILAAFLTRYRGATRVSTIAIVPKTGNASTHRKTLARGRTLLVDAEQAREPNRPIKFNILMLRETD
jgi:hypothetical protein